VRPRVLLDIALAIVVGLMLGCGLPFFIEYFDNTIKTPDEVERFLGLPTLGIVPVYDPRRGWRTIADCGLRIADVRTMTSGDAQPARFSREGSRGNL
jgi:hypothetical protein